jgi:TPR repeat protein
MFKTAAKAQFEKCDALENGTPAKQYKIAKCLLEKGGIFVTKNRSMAIKLFKKAADNGHVESAYETYLLSFFKKKEETYGIKYLEFAAEKGHERAQLELARCYMNINKKGLYDPEKGFKILKNLVKTKNEQAYLLIGRAYETGKGTEIDLEKALKYYKKANNKDNYFMITKHIHRVDVLMNNPSKNTLEKIAKKYPDMYKMVKGDLVAIL